MCYSFLQQMRTSITWHGIPGLLSKNRPNLSLAGQTLISFCSPPGLQFHS